MRIILYLFLGCIVTGCSNTTKMRTEKVTAYYKGFEDSDYRQIKRTIADSLITINGDFTSAFSRESYYQQFKWDSVFKPVYKLVKIENQNGHSIATVSVHTSKFEFLKNNPLIFKQQFSFNSGKISKIENIGFIDVNWETWQNELKTLVDWVKDNHPELNGFQFNLTMKGAIDYTHAIELYKQSN